ncbi:MAG TPA: HAD family hydrolase [Acidimicrobiia bacterium]|nr:HAD family hydrolase [Acidimicrobiia bacterium]
MSAPRLHLIFDADDTLWEANILFERAIDDFIAWLAHPTLEPASIRATLHDIEAANSVAHGYGTRVFLRSLHECFEDLLERPPTAADRASIESLAAPLLSHAIEPIADVHTTLDALGQRHDLLLLTKGDHTEQRAKIDVSGLSGHFRRIVIVPEKNADVYARLVDDESLDPECTWMVGNSPKSDILPALAAGIGAVFIPNVNTWAMEHDEIDETVERLIQIDRFADLLTHF